VTGCLPVVGQRPYAFGRGATADVENPVAKPMSHGAGQPGSSLRRVIGSSRADPAVSPEAPLSSPRTVWSSGSPRSISPPPPGGADRSPGRRSRIRLRHVLVAIAVLVVGVPLFVGGLLWRDYSRVERVDLDGVLSSVGSRAATNTLIVGTDSREGIRVSGPNSGAFIAGSVTGSRTDTIMVLHSEGSLITLVSIPRDLWVTDPATGEKTRINATFGSGAANLVRTVSALGIPVDHYLEIDFSGFGDMVDAVGGVVVDFAAPARDTHSGLDVSTPGRHRLGGTEALAYVRSRYYEQLIGGHWKVDGTADLGRTERQRSFLTTLFHSVVASRSPIALVRVGSAAADGLVLDRSFGLLDLVDLARSLDGGEMVSDALPVTPRVTSGGADVLDLQPSARAVLDRLAS